MKLLLKKNQGDVGYFLHTKQLVRERLLTALQQHSKNTPLMTRNRRSHARKTHHLNPLYYTL